MESTALTYAPLIILVVIFVALVGLLFASQKKTRDADREEILRMAQEMEPEDESSSTKMTQNVTQRGPYRMRRRNRTNATTSTSSARETVQVTADADDRELMDENGDEIGDEDSDLVLKKTKKKKEANREAKRERQEAQAASISAKKEREEKRQEEERMKEEKRQEEERIKLEEEKKIAEEKARKEQEEYEQWKSSIVVENEGDEAAQIQVESQGLLGEFIEYIKKHKVVVLEELASEFKLRTEEAYNRVEALEKMGSLTGIFDDRGKFIYISQEELESVAQFIKKRGRVAISDLSVEAGKIINLTSS